MALTVRQDAGLFRFLSFGQRVVEPAVVVAGAAPNMDVSPAEFRAIIAQQRVDRARQAAVDAADITPAQWRAMLAERRARTHVSSRPTS